MWFIPVEEGGGGVSDQGYRVVMEKRVRGKVEVVKEVSERLKVGGWMVVGVEVMGSRIAGYLDGRRVIEVSDNALRSGNVVLLMICTKNGTG